MANSSFAHFNPNGRAFVPGRETESCTPERAAY
jgi:hypothetical protein